MKSIDEALHDNPEQLFFIGDLKQGDKPLNIDELIEKLSIICNCIPLPSIYLAKEGFYFELGDINGELKMCHVLGNRLKGVKDFIKNIGV